MIALNALVASIDPVSERGAPEVQHALSLRSALSFGNYSKAFKLIRTVPKMGLYLVDHFIERERCNALVTMTKACVSPFSHFR